VPFSTRETVAFDTPARSETSSIVAILHSCFHVMPCSLTQTWRRISDAGRAKLLPRSRFLVTIRLAPQK